MGNWSYFTPKIAENQWVSLGLFHPEISGIIYLHLGVNPKIGVFTPKIINFNKVLHNKPSILGVVFPLFLGWHPYHLVFPSRWEIPPVIAVLATAAGRAMTLRRNRNKNLSAAAPLDGAWSNQP